MHKIIEVWRAHRVIVMIGAFVAAITTAAVLGFLNGYAEGSGANVNTGRVVKHTHTPKVTSTVLACPDGTSLPEFLPGELLRLFCLERKYTSGPERYALLIANREHYRLLYVDKDLYMGVQDDASVMIEQDKIIMWQNP